MNVKKILAGIMTCCVVAGVMPSVDMIADNAVIMASAEETPKAGTCGENLTWVLDDEGTLTISGTGDMEEYGWIGTPWKYDNFNKVIIENGVTSISNYAFQYCLDLTSVTIPDSVTSIGINAFKGTPWLEKKCTENALVIVNGILIDGSTCSGNVVVPDGVTSISGYAFEYCEDLTSIIIPESVIDIGACTFSSCSNLTSITIPDSVKNVGYDAFFETAWLKVKQAENPLVIVNKILIDGSTCSGNVVIPDGVTNINDFAFQYCEGLTSVTIPNSVTKIGDSAFRGCTSLTEITIPDSVTKIGNMSFSETAWLKAKQAENPLVVINGILIDGTTCSGNVVIPNNVKTIGNSAFNGCSDLTEITISENVKSIGSDAFNGCSNLTKITIPKNVTKIEDYAIFNCGVKEITILNPKCDIYHSPFTLTQADTIYGYEGSTVQKYAERFNCNFVSLGKAPESTDETPNGDANGDGTVNVADAIVLQKWLLGSGNLTNWENVDLCKDGRIDVFDMIEMRKLIISS